MRAAARALLAVALLATACADAAQREAALESAPPETASASDAWAEDPQLLLLDAMQTGPRAVVDLLFAWDTAGLRREPAFAAALGQLWCFQPDAGCAGQETGWDFVIAVRGFQVEAEHTGGDSARFVVVFDEIGVIWPDGMEEPEPAPPQAISLRLIDGLWRVVGRESELAPHLSVDAIARYYRGVHPDSSVIVRWLHARE